MKKAIILVLLIAIAAGLAVLGFRNFKSATTPTPVVTTQTGLIVNVPKANNAVTSPLTVSGYVNGHGWNGFEGQVGSVKLIDDKGNVLAQKPLTAITEWTTTTVWFKTILEFNNPSTQTGKLIFRNENPSGMPERDKQFILPVKF